jgi:hypothetical protein
MRSSEMSNGIALGSIIAAVISIHAARKTPSLSSVPVPCECNA